MSQSSRLSSYRGPVVAVVLITAIALVVQPEYGLGFLVLAVAAAGLTHLLRPASVHDVDEFAKWSGLTTTPASRRFIAHHLATGRRLRVVLVLAAIVVPPLVGIALGGSGNELPTGWTGVLWACMAGTLWAELSVTRIAGPARAALLVPRRPADYLSPLLQWAPVVAGALAALVWAGAGLLPDPDTAGVARLQAGGSTVVANLVLALVVPLVTVGAQRWIVRRPQPLVDPDLMAADDAGRGASMRNLAAIGTAVVLLNLAGGLIQYVYALDVTPVDWLCGAGVAVSLGLASISWSSRNIWRPTRRPPYDADAAAPTPTSSPTSGVTA
ncbi:MAG TPA: hypothetical protein VGO78_25210 [Acidimicrobiales bacterium]|jgi:hypothetical protein|nr:hypothetical protein [Acidimicrobiales bacterium]